MQRNRIYILNHFHFRSVSGISIQLMVAVFLFCRPLSALAGGNDSLPGFKGDSLETIEVTAFQQSNHWQDAPVAVAALDQKALQFIQGNSLLPAFNSVPGVRFEERSPGSYRLSIRGSLLRSPYGVRNIKVYWDDIPLTDAGGNTYLQLISPEQLSGAEIIKGPASSLYGAGTGGAVLLHSAINFTDTAEDHFKGQLMGGSHHLFYPSLQWEHTDKNFTSHFSFSHQQSDGDRAQDTMQRTVWHWDSKWQMGKKIQLAVLANYADLHYQTPGGITASQWGSDTTAYPLAVRQKAAIYNKTFLGAIKLQTQLGAGLDNQTSILWSQTHFTNPFTTNYEKRLESNYGGRTVFNYHTRAAEMGLHVLAGMEWIAGDAGIDNYGNLAGSPDTVQYKDQLDLSQRTFFAQATLMGSRWQLVGGISAHQQRIAYHRLEGPDGPVNAPRQKALTSYLWSPRIALNYRVTKDLHLYAVAARGFSTPTLAEIHPSDGSFQPDLAPEGGWNYELGIKGQLLNQRLFLDGSIYHFKLDDAIVRRSSATVDEYYVNAGSTRQMGAELWLKGLLIDQRNGWLRQLVLSSSFSYQPYRFLDYQVQDQDYRDNHLTGVPKTIAVFNLQMRTAAGWYLHAGLNCTSRIPLNDANTTFSDNYQLLQGQFGYQFPTGHLQMELFAGADNILDRRYSLGNDINAYGGRFFNPAPGRNYFAGLRFSW